MSWFRKNPLFATALTVCALIVLGELGFAYERYAAWRDAVSKIEQRQADLQAMTQLAPPPRREVAQAIEADLAKAETALASMQAELKGRGPAAERLRTAKAPTARTDAFFDLATYVERMREAARKLGVEVRPEAARFGFAAYAKEGPESELIEAIFKQRQIAQYLLESLIEAKPRALLAVKRERTLTKTEREARAAALANGEQPPEIEVNAEEGPDYFAVGRQVSAQVPGYIEASGFRLVFLGQTAALRTFLNRLATFELPILVRDIEVEVATPEELAPPEEAAPAPADEQPTASPSVVLTETPVEAAPVTAKPAGPPRPIRAPAAVPIVSKLVSKFTVTVEYIDLVAPAAPAADTPAPATP